MQKKKSKTKKKEKLRQLNLPRIIR